MPSDEQPSAGSVADAVAIRVQPGDRAALASMTGFGSDEGRAEGLSWRWEVRSVNGRGLDVRLRLPPGMEAIEPKVREAIAGQLARGNLNVTLSVTRESGEVEIRLNEAALGQVLRAVEAVRARTGFGQPSVEGLLGVRGVLEIADVIESPEEAARRYAAIMAGFSRALASLLAARRAEGERLARLVADQLGRIAHIVETIKAAPARSPAAVRARLAEQVARITESTSAIDPARLAQEAALLAVKADIEEELQRLVAHVEAARDLIAGGGPVGRKLDFLAQEFNREANTLCSKSSDIGITRAGLALKAEIEQMREQVQNIE